MSSSITSGRRESAERKAWSSASATCTQRCTNRLPLVLRGAWRDEIPRQAPPHVPQDRRADAEHDDGVHIRALGKDGTAALRQELEPCAFGGYVERSLRSAGDFALWGRNGFATCTPAVGKKRGRGQAASVALLFWCSQAVWLAPPL